LEIKRVQNRTSSTERMVGKRFLGKVLLPIAYLIDNNKIKYVFGGKQCHHEQILWLK